VRHHTLVNGLSEAGAGAESGYRTNNLWLGYGPHLIHRPPIFKTYKALQPTPNSAPAPSVFVSEPEGGLCQIKR